MKWCNDNQEVELPPGYSSRVYLAQMCWSGVSFGVTKVLFGAPAAQGCWLLQEKYPESSCAPRFRLSIEVCLDWRLLIRFCLSIPGITALHGVCWEVPVDG